MRLTAELLSQAEQRTNPLGERELVLAGLGIPAIENAAATRDAFDAWDLSNNRLLRLDNFPKLPRITRLLCSGNLIEGVDVHNLSQNLPNVTDLTVSYNHLTSFATLVQLGQAFPKLQFLDLVGNAVTRRQYYRLYAIQQFPELRTLDYVQIKPAERDRAQRLAQSAAGAALESDVQQTFTPGESLDTNSNNKSFVAANFTAEQKNRIRDLLQQASSVQEVEEIETAVRKGVLPAALLRGSG